MALQSGSVRGLLLVGLAFAGSFFPPARAGSYLSFDGVRSYVEVPGSDVFSLRTGGGLTVSAWIRPATLRFPAPRDQDMCTGWARARREGMSGSSGKNGEIRKCDQYRGARDDGCSRHPIEVDPEPGSAPLRIGTRDLKSFFKGEIREVRIWNRTLTPSEISNLYSSRVVPQIGLVGEYMLTDGTARDSKGGRNGTVFGATWVPQD